MIPVWTDDPAFAERWVEPADPDWCPHQEDHPARALLADTPWEARCDGWRGWDALVLCRRAPRSQVDLLAELAEGGRPLPDRVFCHAEGGMGFHGQRGRAWATLPGNLHVSALRPLGIAVEEVEAALTAVPAVAVVDVLKNLPGLGDVGLKWVNDVVVAGAKIAGVIVRTQLERDRFAGAVFGVGLNVERVPRLSGEGSAARATSVVRELSRPAPAAEPEPLLRALAAALHERSEQLRREGAGPLVEAYRQRSTVVGQRVVVYEDRLDGTPGPVLTRGRVSGIGERLELWIEGAERPLTRGRLAFEDEGGRPAAP